MNARDQLLAQLRARDPSFKADGRTSDAPSPLLIKTPVRHEELRQQLIAQLEMGDDAFVPLQDTADMTSTSAGSDKSHVSLSLEMPSPPLTVPSGVTYVRWDSRARMWMRVG
jgi:hypothetical protein